MRYLIDFDGTVTKNVEKELNLNIEVNKDVINRINELYNKGHTIKIYSSRGMLSRHGDLERIEQDFRQLIHDILKKNNVLYDTLILGKQSGDLYVDDLAEHSIDFCVKKNILVGKLGRKIVFNKKDFSCKGGHYEILGLIDVLKEFNNVFIFGEFDELPQHKNIKKYEEKNRNIIDLVFLDNGVCIWHDLAKEVQTSVLENSRKMIEIANETLAPVIYSTTDPRLQCAKSYFKNRVLELSQNSLTFRGHQEKFCLLNLPSPKVSQKQKKLVIVGRDNGRAQIYDNLISAIRDIIPVEVYGNFDLKDNKDLLKGEVPANEIHKVYDDAKYSLIVGIENSWLTQKLIECAHFNCVPFIYDQYDQDRLETYDLSSLRIRNEIELHNAICNFEEFEYLYTKNLLALKNKILPFYNINVWKEIYSKIIKEALDSNE